MMRPSLNGPGNVNPANSDGLSAETVIEALAGRTGIIGREVLFFESVRSTNTIALGLADRGCAEGTVVLADEQNGGKGRRGRTWLSPPAVNLYLSVILRPDMSPEDTSALTLMSAVACAGALRNCSSLPVSLKWPNDLMVSEKKTGGILTETRTHQNRTAAVIIGVGININMDTSSLPSEIENIATSVKIETGAPWARAAIAAEVLMEMDKRYMELIKTGRKAIIEAWRRLSSTIGQAVRVATDRDILTGIAEDITDEGRLLVRTGDNSLIEISAGDVTHLR